MVSCLKCGAPATAQTADTDEPLCRAHDWKYYEAAEARQLAIRCDAARSIGDVNPLVGWGL